MPDPVFDPIVSPAVPTGLSQASTTPGDIEFPVPLARFLPSLRATHDEVWSKLLVLNHGKEKKTMKQWGALLESYKTGKRG